MPERNESITKQVIVLRTVYAKPDGSQFGLRKGKLFAQGAHASLAWLSTRVREYLRNRPKSYWKRLWRALWSLDDELQLSEAEIAWIEGSFAKVVVQVDSFEALKEVYEKALMKGVTARLITDSGRTEFHGRATPTAVAIGPDYVSRIDAITGHLELY